MNRIYFLLFVSYLLVGCSAIPKATTDLNSNAKSLSPTPKKGLVYILRPSGMGSIAVFNVEVNGNHIGSTSSKRFLYTYLEPGAYTFSSKAENKSELPLVIEAGQTYYLEQKVQIGIMSARNKLIRINEKDGRFKLQKCFLSKKNLYGQL